ncbi:catabolite gene activator and regulatory subunit of cAMP-dependent protein kinase [Rubidibacter lacunae KORDI 51-2]|uniref:Catabolite gene activator and regulatory subunit of cAMP-dependent protein kinase n=1 Tax=Rubidibacter lacunae KORDI 51-2 TaxID=582515 RepID=U5DP62_9CHRO|nr:Crp/Fnr family transcriptional regulator [Rubidibacter lacunae]ERN42617.1 catabolite gene activator and regulatory subunit of cAMP-dependent protein kinase [Rubidibacter lacunae KORDI 51-2]
MISGTEFPSFSANLATLSRLPFSRSDLLPAQPEILWRVEWGVVRTITWNDDGTVVTLGYWGKGDVVGQPLTRLQPYQIECLTSVEVTAIPSHRWHQVLDAIVAHSWQSEELLSIVRYERVYKRLERLLTWLARKFGRSVATGELIDLRLTHQGIAELIGTTRVTVTRLLKELEAQGKIVRQQRHYIILCDSEVLKHLRADDEGLTAS